MFISACLACRTLEKEGVMKIFRVTRELKQLDFLAKGLKTSSDQRVIEGREFFPGFWA